MATYPDIEVGDLVTATLLDSMLPQSYTKLVATARNTTLTLANDPELLNIPLAIGTYDIDLTFFVTVTTSAQILKTRWAFTGTWAATVRNCIGPGSSNTALPGIATPTNVQGYGTDSQDSNYGLAVTTAYYSISERVRGLSTSVAGNLSFQWAPTASSANNMTVQPGSNFTVRRVG